MTGPPPISLDDFGAEVEAYLAAHYQEARRAERRFVWGEGSDEVRVFQEPEPEREADALPAIRAWRAGLSAAGLGWITGPTEYGGRGLPGAYQRVFERVARGFEVPGDGALTISLGMIAPTILKHGSAEQKKHYLPKMYAGELICCQLFSEPGAGSDLASLRTRAVPAEDGRSWRITGQKVWTSGAHLADIGEIICRTADGPRHHNLTAFLADMRAPGVRVRPLRQMTGGASFNEVFLDDVEVADTARLGEVGEGWPVALTTLANERNAMGHSAFGGAGILSTERLAELVRRAGAADDPVVRRAFGELLVRLRAARYTQAVMGARARAGDAPGPEAALNKIALSDNMARLGEFVAGVLGPRAVADTGEWGTYAWTSVILGAPGYRLGGGTDEVLKNMIAQRVLGLPRAH
ncbi:MAG TPA: acyl-CoA dehydrogenase family protein [Pseudonocardia sp.]|uniref:acyl-CoA dehydrogenase family protein n=1 Tax=Pseudonocardia sp. TaxID=60912 RepID=UPI002CC81B2E|nr:acyl-CoA dehydrogenase family protein [Pseudonocardia sp.]HTF45822.1 acyl-CoA dehydrogenase family protein [Pseudonocardia sp.]